MPVVGLTGGIAAGKTTVGRVFRSKGAEVFDADEVARAVLAKGGPAFKAVRDRFGEEVVSETGEIDRRSLGRRIFGDAGARAELEEMTHPEILRALAAKVQDLPRGAFVVIEAALLLETLQRWTGVLRPEAIVVVFAPPERQIQRLITKRGLDRREAEARIEAQGSWEAKLAVADYVIYNMGSLKETEMEAVRVFDELYGGLDGSLSFA